MQLNPTHSEMKISATNIRFYVKNYFVYFLVRILYFTNQQIPNDQQRAASLLLSQDICYFTRESNMRTMKPEYS